MTEKFIGDYDPAAPADEDQVLGVKGGVVRLFSVANMRTDTTTVRPVVDMGWDTVVTANASAWEDLPIAQDVRIDNMQGATPGTSNQDKYVVKKAGLYAICGHVTHTGASAVTAVEARINRNGIQLTHALGAYAANGHATLGMTSVLACSVDDQISMQTRNGGNAIEGKLVVIWLGPNN